MTIQPVQFARDTNDTGKSLTNITNGHIPVTISASKFSRPQPDFVDRVDQSAKQVYTKFSTNVQTILNHAQPDILVVSSVMEHFSKQEPLKQPITLESSSYWPTPQRQKRRSEIYSIIRDLSWLLPKWLRKWLKQKLGLNREYVAAFARGRSKTIVINQRFKDRQLMKPKYIDRVIGHELGHVVDQVYLTPRVHSDEQYLSERPDFQRAVGEDIRAARQQHLLRKAYGFFGRYQLTRKAKNDIRLYWENRLQRDMEQMKFYQGLVGYTIPSTGHYKRGIHELFTELLNTTDGKGGSLRRANLQYYYRDVLFPRSARLIHNTILPEVVANLKQAEKKAP